MVDLSFNKKVIIGVCVFIVVAVVVIVPTVLTVTKPKPKPDEQKDELTTQSTTTTTTTEKPFDPNNLKGDEASRINCYLEAHSQFENLTKYQCERRGCIYDPNVSHELVPICYFDREKLGYKLSKKNNENEFELKQSGKAPFPGVIDNIQLNVEYYGNNIIRVKIFDPKTKRYEVPIDLNKPNKVADSSNSLAKFVVDDSSLNSNNFFNFKIVRKDDNTAIFDTSFGAFVFSEQYLQIATKLTTKNIYGFGENNHESYKHSLNFMSWGMFARDNAPGWGDNRNLYGHQPYYMGLEDSGKAHGVFLLNSNAMEYLFTPSPSLTLRSIGGIFDFYFIVDEDPMSVTQSYHSLIGLPVFPPYWSLGFQLSRWGYDNLTHIKTVIERTKNAGIPQDVQHADIEYMIGFRDFTVDPIEYNGTYEYFEKVQSEGMKIVLILDPGLVVERNYTPFTTGLERDVFIKWPKNLAPVDYYYDLYSDYVISWCWPNEKIVYPDFFNDETHSWWQKTIDDYRKNRTHGLPFDGLWIDMNEPSSFETNELKPWNWLHPEGDERYPLFTLKCPTNRLDDPPYRTKNTFMFDGDWLLDKKARLSMKTICMISKQGNDSVSYFHYDVHSLYGYTQAMATNRALSNLSPGKRPFVLSRSTFAGSGHYTFHWTGDIDSTWKHMKMSLIGIFEFGMFGFPMIGADICGFFINANLQMCQRWQQLGAFYPFSRNHNANKQIDQDPVAFGDESIIRSTVETLNIRYTLLPYYYTLFYHSHISGGPVARPLLFEFPKDKNTWDNEEQMLIGPAFLVSPVLHEDKTEVNAYIPDTRWYDYRTGKEVTTKGHVTLSAPKEYINLHVRGGYILPTQNPKGALNTKQAREKPFGLLIALNENNEATGDLFWDDGEEIVTNKKYFYANFTFSKDSLNMKVLENYIDNTLQGKHFDEIKIYGIKGQYSEITLNNNQFNGQASYTQEDHVLTLTNLNIPINREFTLSFKTNTRHMVPRHIMLGD